MQTRYFLISLSSEDYGSCTKAADFLDGYRFPLRDGREVSVGVICELVPRHKMPTVNEESDEDGIQVELRFIQCRNGWRPKTLFSSSDIRGEDG